MRLCDVVDAAGIYVLGVFTRLIVTILFQILWFFFNPIFMLAYLYYGKNYFNRSG